MLVKEITYVTSQNCQWPTQTLSTICPLKGQQNVKKPHSQNLKSTPLLNQTKINRFQKIPSNIKYRPGLSGCSDRARGFLCPTQEGAEQLRPRNRSGEKGWVMHKQLAIKWTEKSQTHAPSLCCVTPEAFLPNASVLSPLRGVSTQEESFSLNTQQNIGMNN